MDNNFRSIPSIKHTPQISECISKYSFLSDSMYITSMLLSKWADTQTHTYRHANQSNFKKSILQSKLCFIIMVMMAMRRIDTSAMLHTVENKELRYRKCCSCGGCSNLRLMFYVGTIKYHPNKDGHMTSCLYDGLKDPSNFKHFFMHYLCSTCQVHYIIINITSFPQRRT